MDVEYLLADFASSTRFEDLPAEAIAAAKDHLLHTVGTMLGGSSAEGCNLVVDLMGEWGGSRQSHIAVYGDKVSVHNAVLANSTMAHALDFCDNDDRIAYKSSVCVVPVGLAVSEAAGGITGRELLTAICVGTDVGLRMGLSILPKYHHAQARNLGIFASAAAAGNLLGLKTGQMLDAFGLGACHLVTIGAEKGSLSLTKRLGPGFASQAGVLSAYLAKKGYTSNHGVIAGPYGYFQTHHGREGDLEGLVADLGKVYEITRVGPKPYPCCRFTHASIDAALRLAKENDIHPDSVAGVTVYLCPRDHRSVGGSTSDSLEIKRHPRKPVDAQFSVPWTVAAALVKRDVFIPAFTDAGIRDPETLALAGKVNTVVLPELDQGPRVIKPAIVEIKTNSGKVYSLRVDFPSGSPENPVSFKTLRQNFRRAASFAARPFTGPQIEKIIETVDHLETNQKAGDLGELLIPPL